MGSRRSAGKAELILGLCAVAALGIALRAFVADFPLERDEGEYAYIGQRWLLGDVPYRDTFDQKPPGVFAAYAVIVGLFGTNPAAIHWAAQTFTLGTLVAIFCVGRRLFDPGTGLVAAALAAFMTVDVAVLGNAANTETFMILPLTAGLLAALRAADRQSVPWAAAAGGLGAAALLFKQVALPNVAWHALLLLTAGGRRGALLTAYAGALATVIGSVIGGFAAVGASSAVWECVVGYNASYASSLPIELYPQMFLGTVSSLASGWGPILLLAAIGLAASEPLGRPSWRRLAISWLIVSALGVAVGGYFREHYFIQAVPPVAVLAGRGAVAVGRWFGHAAAESVTTIVTAGAIIVGFGASLPYYIEDPPEKSRRVYGYQPFPEAVVVGDFLRRHAAADDTIFVYGSEPEVLAYAHRRSASRHIFLYPAMTATVDAADRQQSIVHELEERPPRWVVVVLDSVGSSFYGAPFYGAPPEDVPTILRAAVARTLARDYRLVGVVNQGDDTLRAPPAEAGMRGGMLGVWERRPDATLPH